MRPRYHDFFIRGMVPLQHYWPIRDNSKCTSLKFAVEWGNNHTKEVGEDKCHESVITFYLLAYLMFMWITVPDNLHAVYPNNAYLKL